MSKGDKVDLKMARFYHSLRPDGFDRLHFPEDVPGRHETNLVGVCQTVVCVSAVQLLGRAVPQYFYSSLTDLDLKLPVLVRRLLGTASDHCH
ncbi:hypothetical protein EVAR_18129_1 [Eumeta japonica]|uniref:Uncharacterized protein n=1 Tax=Eumeta variegata TaxID=151549 RepID=A0A4C1VI33_EUMVA|nr:hypothetical protein EVAR_18129_1 [Eumeta japonica]